MTNYAFVDLSPDSFPFTVTATDADTGEVLWTQTIAEIGVVTVPGKPEGVRGVRIRIEFANGEVLDQ